MGEIDKMTADLASEERESLARQKKQAEDQARKALIINLDGALAVFVTLGFAGFFLFRSTAGPLREITSAAEKIASEATDFNVCQIRSGSFTGLASALNKIGGRIKDKEVALAKESEERRRSQDTIKELELELEKLVAKRAKETAALEQARQRIQELAQKLDKIASL